MIAIITLFSFIYTIPLFCEHTWKKDENGTIRTVQTPLRKEGPVKEVYYSKASRYTASRCTDLDNARFWIGSKNIWDARFCTFLHVFCTFLHVFWHMRTWDTRFLINKYLRCTYLPMPHCVETYNMRRSDYWALDWKYV